MLYLCAASWRARDEPRNASDIVDTPRQTPDSEIGRNLDVAHALVSYVRMRNQGTKPDTQKTVTVALSVPA